MKAGAKAAKYVWVEKIERLRERLGLSQAGLARVLNVSPMATSRWERGVNEPPAYIYLEMGKMSGSPECWWFWERAGLSKADVMRAMGEGKRR